MKSICLVEDELKVAAFIKSGLEEQGYRVSLAECGDDALLMLRSQQYDLLILDVMLPGLSGVDLCRLVRADDKQLPILMLTALGATADKVGGLKAGADDYLVKPFHFEELLARLEALLRRGKPEAEDESVLKFGDLELNRWKKTASRSGILISLTAREYALLELFLSNPNKVLSRQFIAEKVWDIGFDTGTNVIDVYVNYLRNKVDKNFGTRLIHTVIGMGYILKNDEN